MAWVRRQLVEIALIYSNSHLRRCVACGAFYRHDRMRDTESGTAEERLRRTDDRTTIDLLLQALSILPRNPKTGTLQSLEDLLGPPEVDRPGIEAGEALAFYQAERLADPSLVPLLAPFAHKELAARALLACGAIDVLVESETLAATHGLGRSGAPEAEPALRARLKHENWQIRLSAAWGLGELGRGADALRAAMTPDEKWYQVREKAALALARVQDSRTLVDALRDEDWHNRWNTAEGIADVGLASPEVIDALKAALLDPRCGVPAPQLGALRALLSVGVPHDAVRELIEGAMGSHNARFDANLADCLKGLSERTR